MYQLKGYDGISIGAGQPLLVMAGLNVLEDEGLALEVAAELKQICSDLSLPYVFKASFDKANRSSIASYRGPGQADGLAMLASVKAAHGYPLSLTSTRPNRPTRLPKLPRLCNCLPFLCAKPIWWSRRPKLWLAMAAGCMQKGAVSRAVGLREYYFKGA